MPFLNSISGKNDNDTSLELHTDTYPSYRQIPTFGRDTIQRFRCNVSELKKMAAQDFEDLLQVDFKSPLFASLNSLIEYLFF